MLKPKGKNSGILWRVVVKPYFGSVLLVFGLMFASSVLEVATVGLGVPLIQAATSSLDRIQPGSTLDTVRNVLASVGYAAEDRGKFIFALLLIVSIVAVLKAAFLLAHKYAVAVIAQTLRKESKLNLLGKIIHSSYGYIAKRSRGAMLYDINYPSQALYVIIFTLGNFFSNLINAVLMVSLMLYLSVPATITIALVGGAWLYFWRHQLGPRMTRAGKKIYDLNQVMGKADVDMIDGLRVIRSNNLESKLLLFQEKLLVSEMDPKKKAALYSQGLLFVNEVSAGLVIVVLGGITFGLGWFSLDFAKLVVLLLAVRRISPALSAIGTAYLEIKKEMKSVETIENISLHTPQERKGGVKDFFVETVEFRNLNFEYASNKAAHYWNLKDVNINVRKGESIAVVGPTGSGKSTLVNLLLGFYKPKGGRITVNNISLDTVDLDYWRSRVGYVSQDVFLFNENIFQNIVLWDESIGMEDVVRAAKVAQIHDFIESLPEGYDTHVGDRGMKLSGGQCQRIAIARILLKTPDVIVFDEATSALDNITEKAVYNAIQSLGKETIIFIIAHRLSSLQHVDKIFVLDSGRIVEDGTHADLMQTSGIYSQLYREGGHYEKKSVL